MLGFSSGWTETFRCTNWVPKRQRNQRSNHQHLLDHRESRAIPEKKSGFASLTTWKLLTVLFIHSIMSNSQRPHGLQHARHNNNKLWKILKEMIVPGHLTCLLRNLYIGQEATVRTLHGTNDWFKIEKRVHQGYILSPCLFNLYAE